MVGFCPRHSEIMQKLLDSGADINLCPDKLDLACDVPLLAAILGDHQSIITTLLEAGADVDLSAKRYGTHLQPVSLCGYESTV
ncbi:hypothetical protein BU25DRAFT_412291 [Macroventuria anomochaeta]|uniref:Uncharacterized protein n=1 Tax=Macroventuria anomochaeta TaxID=301207 RepID=A0ACB6RVI8_9PLEO|nr:uncharacterized protein BU25DRAFT_412291 [Macroventuria anomochaeta]KAF2626061.1 hypothetical protein BU25DRAFT_412291 [Macroventuria anomochaeta]